MPLWFVSYLRRFMMTMLIAAGLRIKKILNSKKAAVVCCCVGVVAKSLVAFFYSDLSADKALYLVFTQSFLNKGALVDQMRIFETGQTVYAYNPAVYSPVYSLLCAPFLWLTKSFFLTQFVVSILGWVLFFSGLYRVARLLFRDYWKLALFLLFSSFFLYCHELFSTPKDTLAVGFTLWAAVFASRFVSSGVRWQTTALLALFLACMCLVKLLYIPLAISFLVTLFFLTMLKRSIPHFLQTVLLLGLLFVIGLFVYAFVFHPAHSFNVATLSGPTRAVVPAERGVYWSNLRVTFPFISAAFFDTTFCGVLLERLASVPFSTAMNGFRILDIALLAVILFFVVYYSRRLLQNTLLLFLVLASFTMITAVAYLTVVEKLVYYPHNMGMWSFGVDARSFLIPMITLQLTAALFLFHARGYAFAKAIFLLLALFAFVHGVYFYLKTSVTTPWVPEALANTAAFKKINEAATDSNAAGNGLKIVTPYREIRQYAQVHNLPVYVFTNLQTEPTWLKKGDRFLVAVFPEDSVLMKKFPPPAPRLYDSAAPYLLYKYEVR